MVKSRPTSRRTPMLRTSSSYEARWAGGSCGMATTPPRCYSSVVVQESCPLIAMMRCRHHARLASTTAMRLIYSARTLDDVIRRSELTTMADSAHRDVTVTLTRELSSQWTEHRDRVDARLLSEVGWPPRVRPRCYVCGPTPFVEDVSAALVDLGHEAAMVKTERFGPTGE